MVGFRGIPATYGGVEKHVEELAPRLVQRGHEVIAFCRPHYTPSLKTFKGVRIVRLPTLNQKHVEMSLHTLLSIQACPTSIDLLHIQSVDPALFALLGKLKLPVVATSHGQAYRREKWGRLSQGMSKLAERSFIAHTDARISVSKTLKHYYEQTYSTQVTYIPNGVNSIDTKYSNFIEPFGLKPDGYILFVGRLIPTKGPGLLVEAYKKLDPDVKLAIVGGSSHTSEYEKALKQHASEKIYFLGYQYAETLWQLFQDCRLFVFPSEIEGLPITLLEAMSFGKPILFSDIPENLEAAEGVGISFRNKDPEDLQEKIQYCFAHPEEMQALGQKAKERVRAEYDWDQVADAHDRLYRRLLCREGTGRGRPEDGEGRRENLSNSYKFCAEKRKK